MNVLVLNAGSSSLKYQLIDIDTEEVCTLGLCERVGSEGSFHKYGIGDKEQTVNLVLNDHKDAVKAVIDSLIDPETGVLKDLSDIHAIGHRVVHGADVFSQSVVIDDEVIAEIDKCSEIAPLHNPPALAGINACRELMPNLVQVAVFDTSFHQTMPPRAFRYALPTEYYETKKIRRYGFHGTSHRYVSERAAAMLGKPIEELKIITCHLGNGGSITAVDKGKSVDTSMGFTPLEGLMMGTRSGSLDPAIVLYLLDDMGMTTAEVNDILNKKSGVLGISGISNDLRDIKVAADKGDEKAKLAYEMYSYEAKKFIGSYAFAMGGVDAIVCTAGVGENDSYMRSLIFEGLEELGISLDVDLNAKRGGERFISTEDSAVKIMVIPTNEELMIARDVKALAH